MKSNSPEQSNISPPAKSFMQSRWDEFRDLIGFHKPILRFKVIRRRSVSFTKFTLIKGKEELKSKNLLNHRQAAAWAWAWLNQY